MAETQASGIVPPVTSPESAHLQVLSGNDGDGGNRTHATFPPCVEDVIDLFAGPGGWELAARALGLDPLGIEWDDAACATRKAAGLRTLQADVAALDPYDFAPCDTLIASPPCQAFSTAGKGEGRRAMGAYLGAIARWQEGKSFDRDELDEQCGDERAHLVLEPLRWAGALRPRWIACEQVEPVLPIWEAMAAALRDTGYQTWTGVLSAERYGVPQTRRRAILLASLDGPVGEPPATHQRYVAPRRRDEATESLFDLPEPERIVPREDEHLEPWVSMVEALGWAPADRYLNGTHDHRAEREASEPAPTLHFGQRLNTVVRVTDQPWTPQDEVGFPRRNDRPGDAGEYRERDLRPASEPAFALTEITRSWQRWITDTGNTRSGSRSEGRSRPSGAPAPVVTSRADQLEWRDAPPADVRDWKPTHLDTRQSHAQARPVDQPAPTMVGDNLGKGAAVWTDDPATETTPGTGYKPTRGVRVSLAEALILQSFPPDYPVQGTKSKQFEQVGNAVPPLLALNVLTALVGEHVNQARDAA